MTNLLVAARRYLATKTDLTDLLGTNATYDTWIFRNQPYVDLRDAEQAMIVLNLGGQWASPDHRHTLRFPRLVVATYVDPARDSEYNPSTVTDPYERADIIHQVLLSHLSHIDGSMTWDDVPICSSISAGEPDVQPALEKDGMVRSVATFNLELG